jgi:hypothetical protein
VTEKWTDVTAVTGNHLNMKLNDCSTVSEYRVSSAFSIRTPEDTDRSVAAVCDYLAKIMNPLVANVTASGRQEVYTRGAQFIYLIEFQLPYSNVRLTKDTNRQSLASFQRKKNNAELYTKWAKKTWKTRLLSEAETGLSGPNW